MFDMIISAMDREQLRRHARAGGDVLQFAEELGYAVDKDFILELMFDGIPISDEKITTTTLKMNPKDAENPRIGTIIRDKVNEIFNHDEPFMVALAHNYKGQEIKRIRPQDPKHVTKRVKVPKYMRTLIRGIGLIEATSVEEIRNFELSEEDKRRQERVKFSYRSPREQSAGRSFGRT